MGICVNALVHIIASVRDSLKTVTRISQKPSPRLNVDHMEPLVLGFNMTRNIDASLDTCWTGEIIEKQAYILATRSHNFGVEVPLFGVSLNIRPLQ